MPIYRRTGASCCALASISATLWSRTAIFLATALISRRACKSTSVVGMMPLVLFPGAGSELYRGLGSVVVGGLALSAILTLGIIPSMMSLFLSLRPPRRPISVQALEG